MKKRRKLITIILMSFVLVAESLFALADPSTDEEIDKTKNERDETQNNLNEVNATIESLSEEVGDIQEELDEVTSALVQVMAEIEVIEDNIAEKEVEIQDTEVLYEAAVEKEKQQYEAMKVRIKYLYENGSSDILKIYMEAGSIADALTKEEYIESLYAYDRKMLAEYQNTVTECNNLHETLLAEKDELLDLQADYEEEKEYMEQVMEELQEVADDYYGQIAEAKNLANQYSAQIKEQNKEIKRLEEKKKKEEEEARRKAEEEEARRRAQEAMAETQDSGVVVTTNNSSYDVSSIYSANGSDLGKNIAAFACQFIGNPYVPGGTSLTDGADCSGFVFSVYKNFGYKVPRTSSSLRSAGVEVAYSEAQPGDVVCYPGHVAIYIGNGMIVHASTKKTGIKISRAEYRSILCVRRII